MAKKSFLEELTAIAAKTGLFGSYETSTIRLARELGFSQQSASRILREMENNGLIKREVSVDGVIISLEEKGRELLKSSYAVLRRIFDIKKGIVGVLTSGIDEGGYYIALEGYQKQFREKLGFKAFEGTLNLKADKINAMNFLSGLNVVKIDGFKAKNRSYGALNAYKVKINDKVNGAIIIPERTLHDRSVIEIIAPVKLRDEFKLKDGDKLKIGL